MKYVHKRKCFHKIKLILKNYKDSKRINCYQGFSGERGISRQRREDILGSETNL